MKNKTKTSLIFLLIISITIIIGTLIINFQLKQPNLNPESQLYTPQNEEYINNNNNNLQSIALE